MELRGMHPKHRRLIQDNYSYLEKNVELKRILPALKQTKIFTKPMLYDIESGEEKLFKLLPKRGPNAFAAFLDALKASGYDQIAEKLENEDLYSFKGSPVIQKGYKMQSEPRGYCLIVHVEFDKEAIRLKEVFDKLGFSVTIHDNPDGKMMFKGLVDFSKRDFSRVDSCVVYVLSRGGYNNNREVFYASDGNHIDVDEVLEYYDNSNCKGLKQKPKVFFFPNCIDKQPDVKTEDTDSVGFIRRQRIPGRTDMLTLYVTNPGMFSKELASVLLQNAHNTDLESMLEETYRNVLKKGSDRGFRKFTFGWGHSLYFNPVQNA